MKYDGITLVAWENDALGTTVTGVCNFADRESGARAGRGSRSINDGGENKHKLPAMVSFIHSLPDRAAAVLHVTRLPSRDFSLPPSSGLNFHHPPIRSPSDPIQSRSNPNLHSTSAGSRIFTFILKTQHSTQIASWDLWNYFVFPLSSSNQLHLPTAPS